MSRSDFVPSDSSMVEWFSMYSRFMLMHMSAQEVKRLIEDIEDGMDWTLDEEGNVIEADFSVIERELDDVHHDAAKRINGEIKARETARSMLSELRPKMEDMESYDPKLQGKVHALEKVLGE